MQSLPLYEAKPATLVARQSAKMSLFIVIDLRRSLAVARASGGVATRDGGAARRAKRVGIRGASVIGFKATTRPDARFYNSSRAAPPRLASTDVCSCDFETAHAVEA